MIFEFREVSFVYLAGERREREKREKVKREKKIEEQKIFSLHNLSKKKNPPLPSSLSLFAQLSFFQHAPPDLLHLRSVHQQGHVAVRRLRMRWCQGADARHQSAREVARRSLFFSRERGVRDERARESDETFHAFLFLSRDFFFSPSTSRRALRDRPHPFVAVWSGLTHGEGRHETREKKAETKKKRQR